MILSRVIGPCPKCSTVASFGNFNISSNLLTRACKACGFKTLLPLPKLSKTIVYLDQFFFSHAFRDSSSDFAAAISLIRDLAHHQLIVIPFSPTHRTETSQWTNENRGALWEFIRTTSRGQQFLPPHQPKQSQILRSYESFLNNEPVIIPTKRSDVFIDNINHWEDYFWVDVEMDFDDSDRIRESKASTVRELLSLFDNWRKHQSTFDEDIDAEFHAAGQNYIKFFAELLVRTGLEGPSALYNSHQDSMIVEAMIRNTHTTQDPIERLATATRFFSSEHFRNVPYERISNGILAALKHRVKMGQFSNPEKAKKALSGFMFDLQFIATYLPYCHAMFIDQAMFEIVSDSRLRFTELYGTKIFSRANWDKFLDYLASIEKRLSPEAQRALKWVYPEDYVGAKA